MYSTWVPGTKVGSSVRTVHIFNLLRHVSSPTLHIVRILPFIPALHSSLVWTLDISFSSLHILSPYKQQANKQNKHRSTYWYFGLGFYETYIDLVNVLYSFFFTCSNMPCCRSFLSLRQGLTVNPRWPRTCDLLPLLPNCRLTEVC